MSDDVIAALTKERDEAEREIARLREAGRARLSRAREALAALVPCDDGRCPDHPPDFSPDKVAALREALKDVTGE